MFADVQYNAAKVRLRIDIMDLETELIEHPSRLQSVVEYAADALQLRDAFKVEHTVTFARAVERIRAVPEADSKAPSETKAKSLAELDASVAAANEQLMEAEHDLRYWQGMAEAYREKGGSLKRISELTIAGWLAPNTARRKEVQEVRANSITPQEFVSKRKGKVNGD